MADATAPKKRRKASSPRSSTAVKNSKKSQALARKAGYESRLAEIRQMGADMGIPEEYLPETVDIEGDRALIIPPNDQVAMDAFLERAKGRLAPLWLLTAIQGLKGAPVLDKEGNLVGYKINSKVLEIVDKRLFGQPKQTVEAEVGGKLSALLQEMALREVPMPVIPDKIPIDGEYKEVD